VTEPADDPVPPAGEQIHLPGNSALPILSALGITLAVVGTTVGLILIVVGLVLFLTTTVLWIRDTRRDISELPPDHGA